MKPHSDATSWALILSTVYSLVSIICLLQIDAIIRGTLYDYGLQFSYSWASPYLRLTQIAFAVGWINIVVASAVGLNKLRTKYADNELAAIEEARKTRARANNALEPEKASERGSKEHKEAQPSESTEEAPAMTPESKVQDKKEEPQQKNAPEQEQQQPEQAPEQETQQPETPEEIPSLADLFQ